MSGLRLCVKIWLESDDPPGKAFGDGACDLLKRVRRTGSLRQAADEIGMSYSQAWKLVRGLEARLGFAILESTVGGIKGGASRLTPRAEVWVETYDVFRRECQEFVAARFGERFGGLLGAFAVAEPGRRPATSSNRR